MASFNEPIRPMTLGNMRANGVHSLAVFCHLCDHEAIISAAKWSDDVPVPVFGPRMVCTMCGIVGADARPNWLERGGADMPFATFRARRSVIARQLRYQAQELCRQYCWLGSYRLS
jgi:hypothetical protein